jgi:hypothetical protein
MPSRTDEGEIAGLVNGPALRVDFEYRVWGYGGAAAKIQGEDLAADGGLAEFAGVLGFAENYAGAHRWGHRRATGGTAVEKVAHDAEEGLFGEVAVLGVVFLAQEGCELARVEGSDVRLLDAFARHEGEGNAFGAMEEVGALCAAEELLDLQGSGIEWVGVFSLCGNFLFFQIIRNAHRDPAKFSGLPDWSIKLVWRSGRV